MFCSDVVGVMREQLGKIMVVDLFAEGMGLSEM